MSFIKTIASRLRTCLRTKPPRLFAWSSTVRARLIIGGTIAVLVLGFWLMASFCRQFAVQPPGRAPEESAPAARESAIRDPLTGALLDAEREAPHVFAVMVENMVEAWPLSGLDRAFLVIEAPVEAGIPRFIAFYDEASEVEKIGPVRSARPYYVDWANEFDALYAHVGGSDAALSLIATTGTFDLNEFSYGSSFWRATNRYAPHNAYTSTDLLRQALESRIEKETAPEPLYGTWNFKDDEPAAGAPDVPDVSVDFSTPTYRAAWRYVPEENSYQRLQAGAPQSLQDGTDIGANNVAVIVTDVEIIDSVGRREIKTIGEGKAFVLQDGRVIDGSWKKPSVSERLRFYAEDGSEIAWNAGSTWIEVVPSESSVDFGDTSATSLTTF